MTGDMMKRAIARGDMTFEIGVIKIDRGKEREASHRRLCSQRAYIDRLKGYGAGRLPKGELDSAYAKLNELEANLS